MLNNVRFINIRDTVEKYAARGLYISEIVSKLNNAKLETRYDRAWTYKDLYFFIQEHTALNIKKISLRTERRHKQAAICSEVRKIAKKERSTSDLLDRLTSLNIRTLNDNPWTIAYLRYYLKLYKIKLGKKK